MKLRDGRITFLVNQEYTEIELHDNDASVLFAKIRLTPIQLSQALSRLGRTECSIEIFNLENIGKKMIHKNFEFEIPRGAYDKDAKEVAIALAKKLCPEGWVPDLYFSSRGSFQSRLGHTYANCTIRKYVDWDEVRP